jgi:hypothetical protein
MLTLFEKLLFILAGLASAYAVYRVVQRIYLILSRRANRIWHWPANAWVRCFSKPSPCSPPSAFDLAPA